MGTCPECGRVTNEDGDLCPQCERVGRTPDSLRKQGVYPGKIKKVPTVRKKRNPRPNSSLMEQKYQY